jgi:hypothetical protein
LWVFGESPATGGKGKTMLDKLLSIKNTQSHSDKFTILNTKMDMAVAIDLLLSVFDYERCETLSAALVAEIKRRKAMEKDAKTRVGDVRRKVTKNVQSNVN